MRRIAKMCSYKLIELNIGLSKSTTSKYQIRTIEKEEIAVRLRNQNTHNTSISTKS